MMTLSVWKVAVILMIVVLVFGLGKLPRVMGDVAKGIKNFRAGMKDDDADAVEAADGRSARP